jgi:hypothetical protein
MPLKIGALEVHNLSDTKVRLTQRVWLGGHVYSVTSLSHRALPLGQNLACQTR